MDAVSQAKDPTELDVPEYKGVESWSSFVSVEMVVCRNAKMSKEAQNVAAPHFLIVLFGISSPLKHNRGFSAEDSDCETNSQTTRSLRTSRSAGVSMFK